MIVSTAGNNPNPNDVAAVGLAVVNNELYVADPVLSQMYVYNVTNITALTQVYTIFSRAVVISLKQPSRVFPLPFPGQLCADQEGYIWMLQNQTRIIRMDSNGNILPQEIIIPSTVIPMGFTIDNQNNLYLTNLGPDQNIL